MITKFKLFEKNDNLSKSEMISFITEYINLTGKCLDYGDLNLGDITFDKNGNKFIESLCEEDFMYIEEGKSYYEEYEEIDEITLDFLVEKITEHFLDKNIVFKDEEDYNDYKQMTSLFPDLYGKNYEDYLKKRKVEDFNI